MKLIYFAIFGAIAQGSLCLGQTAFSDENHEDPVMRRKSKSKFSMKPDANDEDNEMIFNSDEGVFLGYGAVTSGGTSIAGDVSPTFGLRGAWVINEKYAIGIDFYGTTDSVKPHSSSDDQIKKSARLRFSQVGLMGEYYQNSNRYLHPVYTLIIGSAKADYTNIDESSLTQEEKNSTYKGFLSAKNMTVIEPQAALEVNVTKYIRMSGGIGFRLLMGGNSDFDQSNSKLMGVNAIVALKFGNFRY
jgi:hypothetical protein